MPDLFHVSLLAANAFMLSLSAALYARTRYHSREARGSATYARASRADAKKFADCAAAHADRLDLPRILPFAPPTVLKVHLPDDHAG